MHPSERQSTRGPGRASWWWQFVAAAMAIAAGVLQALSLAMPFDLLQPDGWLRGQTQWWLQPMAMMGLVALLARARSPGQAAWWGWLFSSAWLAATFAWLYISMHTYGGLPAALSVLAVLALAGALAIYYAVACWCFWTLAQSGIAQSALYFAMLWMLAELARGSWLTGFGWGAIGYAQADGPLVAFFPWVGSYGVGALVAFFSAGLGLVLARGMLKKFAVMSVMTLCFLAVVQHLPAVDGQAQASLRVTLLQGNIAQEEKFQPQTGIPDALKWYGAQLINSGSSLIIAPETALPLLPSQLPQGYWQTLEQRFGQGAQAALLGVPMGDYLAGYTNSVAGFKPGQATPWRYDKHHLVPFGEFIPPFFRWFTDLMHIPLGDFERGALPQPTFDWLQHRLAVSVCFENLFGEELAAQFGDSAKAPTVLVNVSNLGWFGQSLAMDQHLHIARVRALEFGRPFLLATNTGRTAIVDHRGRVTASMAPHQVGQLQGEVQGRVGNTPYASWVSRWGLWPLWLLALAVLLLAWRVHR